MQKQSMAWTKNLLLLVAATLLFLAATSPSALAAVPNNTSPPLITGNAAVDDVLFETDNGTWDGDPFHVRLSVATLR